MYACLGMVMGQGGVEGWDLRPAPAPHGFVFPHPHPTPRDGKNFIASFSPPEAPQSSAPPRKTQNSSFCWFAQSYYYFFNKTYFINKNILEITNKFIPSNQTNF